MFSIKRTLKSFLCCVLVATLFSSFTVSSAVNVTDLNNNSPILTINNEDERYIGGAAIGYSYFVIAQNEKTKESYVYMSNEYKEDWTKKKINIDVDSDIVDVVLYAGRYYILANKENLVIYSSNNLTNWEKVFDTEIKAKKAEMVAGETNLLIKVADSNNDVIYRVYPESHSIEELYKFKDHAEALIFYKNMFMAASKNYFYLISDVEFKVSTTPVSEIIGTKIDEIIAYQPMETQCSRSSIYLMYKLDGQIYTKQIHTSISELGWEPIRDTMEYHEDLVKNYTSYTDVVGLWGYPILVINDGYFYVTKMKSDATPLKCDEKKVEWAFHYDVPSNWAATQIRFSAQKLILTPATTPREYTANITREDFAKYTYNLLKNYLILDGQKVENPFTDTDCEEVLILRRLGIIKGTSETTFSPDKKLTRAEAATMLMRIYEKYGKFTGDIVYNEFVDNDEIPSWARDAVYYARTIGIMSGYDGNVFGPNDPYTYEQSLVTLARLSENIWQGDTSVCTTCTDQEEENHQH